MRPEKVAEAIVELARHPRRERNVPAISALALMAHFAFPNFVERAIFEALRGWHFDDTPKRDPRGNLFEPSKERAAVRGSSPPQIGISKLLIWLAKRLLKVGATAALARMSGRATPS